MIKQLAIAFLLLQSTFFTSKAQVSSTNISPGANQTAAYFPLLKNKKIGLVVNITSTIGQKLSVDSLVSGGFSPIKIFAPEHGFRGESSNGASIANNVDEKTGIPIISLYGKHLKPSAEDLKGIDLLIFDIQDVGARFYTYLSTLHYVMEACAENNIPLLVLDRPNPNGFYVDGPVLEPSFASFIGMHPVPIVYGMTIGEYAQMINGEKWLKNGIECDLKIIPVADYTHKDRYTLPIKPSPNLTSQQAILLYPSLCLFEGTAISQGRGTYTPFQVLGAPALISKFSYSFKPKSIAGMSENPIHLGQDCYGLDLSTEKIGEQLNLDWLLTLYKAYPDKKAFFDTKQYPQMGNFDKLAGTASLKQQIIQGKSIRAIRKSWEPALSRFKLIRKKYLIYP
ncbi:MAG: exo-beta-N-acetylmuramidase NamZ domain-containing protein [Sphingobacteriaceae bacterium]